MKWTVILFIIGLTGLIGTSYWYTESYTPNWCEHVDLQVYKWGYESETGNVTVQILDRGDLTPESAVVAVDGEEHRFTPENGKLKQVALPVGSPPDVEPRVRAEDC